MEEQGVCGVGEASKQGDMEQMGASHQDRCSWESRQKFKARVVAKGFREIEGVDYDETFAPTIRFESIQSLIAMGVAEGWHFDQLDVSTTLLYAELMEETYVEVPDGISGEEGMI